MFGANSLPEPQFANVNGRRFLEVCVVPDREALFGEYEAAIVRAHNPQTQDEAAWIDPATVCVKRGAGCVVMTAWNPGFERPGRAVNDARNAAMLAVLREQGCEVWSADGSSLDGAFHEPGFLVWQMREDQACALAAEFGQFAIYVYSSTGARRVVACS